MEEKILEAIEEMKNEHYNSIEEVRDFYSETEIFDIWLRYEGIIGYTHRIINILDYIRNK